MNDLQEMKIAALKESFDAVLTALEATRTYLPFSEWARLDRIVSRGRDVIAMCKTEAA